jgi:hypothetical protein
MVQCLVGFAKGTTETTVNMYFSLLIASNHVLAPHGELLGLRFFLLG